VVAGASQLKASQFAMARFLRNPLQQPPPVGVEPRRLQIYQDLVYNNIEGFISGGFPVLRSLYVDIDWHSLVRTFIDQHRCHTPYFLEISQEFVRFLIYEYRAQACDPPFLAELAHYEWVELALDIAPEVLPDAVAVEDVLSLVPQLSPLAWLLSYRFPVHRIGRGFSLVEPTETTYLVVYRNREDQVRFIALNATTARLLEMVRANTTDSVGGLLDALARELQMPLESIMSFGAQQFNEFLELAVVLVTKR
jgi:hypothetical protein